LDDKLYVAGGWNWPISGIPTNTLQIYDSASNTWTTGAGMPRLSGCSVSGAIDGKLYVLTACVGYGGYMNYLDMYDPATNSWTGKAGSPHDHADGAAGVIDGKLYVAGGSDEGGNHAYLDVYDPATNTWSTLTSMPAARGGMAGAVLNGTLYAMGGTDASGVVGTVEVYDPVTDTWAADTGMPTARSSMPASGVIGTTIYVAGGHNGTNSLATHEACSYGVLTNDSDLHGGAPGENNVPLTAQLVSPPSHAASFTLHADGSFDYTPAGDYNGPDSFTYQAVDSLGGVSNTELVNLTINPVNDEPSFDITASHAVLEDAGAQSVANFATNISAGPSDESGQTLTFNIAGNTNAALFSAGPAIGSNGALSYTPAADANGSATITVELKDNGGTANGGDDTSPAQTFDIIVTSVNDAPSFDITASHTVLEDAVAQSVANFATNISTGPSDESGQTLTFNITGNTAPAFFSAARRSLPTAR